MLSQNIELFLQLIYKKPLLQSDDWGSFSPAVRKTRIQALLGGSLVGLDFFYIGYLVIVTPSLPLLIVRDESLVNRYIPVSCETLPRTIQGFNPLLFAHWVYFF